MTNKTDKEILDEFERLPTDSAPWQDAAFEIVLKDFLLKDEARAFLKQALSRKEEEMIELFKECLPEEEKDTFENDGNVGHLTTGRYCFAFNNCLSQIKDNLKSKGIKL